MVLMRLPVQKQCDSGFTRPSRLESECIRGESVRLVVHHPNCSPLPRHLTGSIRGLTSMVSLALGVKKSCAKSSSSCLFLKNLRFSNFYWTHKYTAVVFFLFAFKVSL